MGSAPGIAPTQWKHYFVDEAGDPNLFGSRGRVLVGTAGCSRFFILGLADVENPPKLAANLAAIRSRLLPDPISRTCHPCSQGRGKRP